MYLNVRFNSVVTLIALLGFALLFSWSAVCAAEKDSMNGKLVLPLEVKGWKWDGKDETFNNQTIFKYIDGAGELYLAYGFKGLTVRRFEATGKPLLVAEIYEMGSSEDAYGVFTFERQEEEAGVGQGSEFGGGLLRFWKGVYFVSAYGEGEGAEMDSAVLELGKQIAEAIQAPGSKPALLGFLPDKTFGLDTVNVYFVRSHVLLNQRFFVANQNVMQLGRDVEAVLGSYDREGKRMHLVLVRYPTEKRAQDALQGFLKAYMPEALASGSVKTEDGKWTRTRVYGEFLAIVFQAPAEAEAEKLLAVTGTNLKGKTR
jgi:hypothetical protein